MTDKYYKIAILVYTFQLILLALLINYYFLMERHNYFQSTNTGGVELFFGLTIFVLNITAIFVIRNLYLSGQEAQEQKNAVLKYKHIEEQNRIYRQHRHDLNNQLNVMSGLVKEGEYEKFEKYLSSYLDSIDKSIVKVETGLLELDLLLYTKFSEANGKNISINYKNNTVIKSSTEYVIDLVSIIANAMDNAIEACEKITLGTRMIQVDLSEDSLDYIFYIANTCDIKETNVQDVLLKKGFTTKKGSERGEGLQIIKKNVTKLKGEFNLNINNGFFELKIEIPKYILEGSKYV